MERKALIIFVKNLVAGTVKTRLARTIGPEKALAIYAELLSHTRLVTKNLNCDKFIFYAGHIEHDDEWDAHVFKKELQEGADLGSKMQYAFAKLFAQGYESVVIIGSDCYQLTPAIIEAAFADLKSTQVVIGPATDGGYYLLGLGKPVFQLFHDISWSSSAVLEQTIRVLQKLNEHYALLPTLCDVDREEDLDDKLRTIASLPIILNPST